MDQQLSPSKLADDQQGKSPRLGDELARLEEVFGVNFSLIDAESGDIVLRAAETHDGDWMARGELCRELAGRRTAEIIEDDEVLLLLAIPLATEKIVRYVAIGGFLSHSCQRSRDLKQLAHTLGVPQDEAKQWAAGQTIWPAEHLLKMGELFVGRDTAESRSRLLVQHINDLSDNLSSTYEEISLLHRITANLKINRGTDELAHMALQWLHEVVPAHSIAAYLHVTGKAEDVIPEGQQSAVLFSEGDCPVDAETFTELVDELGLSPTNQMAVMNLSATRDDPWRFTSIRQMMIVTLSAGNKVLGYLAAFNHTEEGEFGTIEASLLSSVATILGIHSGNLELYRHQVQLLSGMVRAMVSAIDAKDPYTCGHSNRVARVSLRLAEQLKCSEQTKNTIYLSGLLHDIGKIGIDDAILRKPGKLTTEEFEHIKKHPELGYNILRDIEQIKDVLPGVLHHHEAWDGSGYPKGLGGEDIPQMARIIAVADAFDAMGNDRLYREGMKPEKLHAILRDGAGKQWDADVVAAFFAAYDDIQEIARREGEQLQLDMRDFT